MVNLKKDIKAMRRDIQVVCEYMKIVKKWRIICIMLYTNQQFTIVVVMVYILPSIYLTESLSNVRSSTFEGTFSVFSGKWSIFIRFSLCDLSLGAPFPGLQNKRWWTILCSKELITFPSMTPKTESAVFAAGHPSFFPIDQCYSSQLLDLYLRKIRKG